MLRLLLVDVDEVELRRVEGRVRQLLTRTFDIKWAITQIVKWALLEQPATSRTPNGYILARFASYGHTFKGRLSRDPKSVPYNDGVASPVFIDTIVRLASHLSSTICHDWMY